MNYFRRFVRKHPIVFSFGVFVGFILIVILSAILGNLWSGNEAYGQPGGIASRLIFIAILLLWLTFLGWLEPAGFTRIGGWRVWLLLLVPLVYSILASDYSLTGSLNLGFLGADMPTSVVVFIMISAFLEEVVFRGILLYGLIQAWGSSNLGWSKSVLVSSIFFCSIHLLDVLGGRPPLNTLLQSVEAFFLGIILAALVLNGRSIYPAAFFHIALNMAAYLSSQGLEPAPSAWLLVSTLMLPVAFLGIYLLSKRSEQSDVPNELLEGIG